MAHENYKTLTPKELSEMFAGVEFKTPPMHHQLVSLAWALNRDDERVFFWHDVGTGKTLIALYLYRLWGARKVLVVAPNSVIQTQTWQAQIKEHTDDDCVQLTGTAKERQELTNSPARFHLLNYEGLKSVFGKKNPEGKGWMADKTAILNCNYDGLVFDESHHLSDPKTLQTNIAAAVSQIIPRAILMTGTPIKTSEIDLWAQYYVLDHGDALGPSFYKFQSACFNRVSMGSFYKFFIRKGARARILNRIQKTTLRYEAPECVDLPEIIEHNHFIELSPAHRKIYDEALSGIREDLLEKKWSDEKIVAASSQLIQIAKGFLITPEGNVVLPGKNAALEELREILRATAALGRKILVCHCFVEEGRMIEKLCRKMNLKFSSLRGEIKNKTAHYNKFIDPNGSSVLIFHPRSAGEGVNLQMANHLVFFSFGQLGAVMRQQVRGRIHRAGQKKSCVMFDLVAKNTVEEAIYGRLNEKVEVSRILLDYIRGKKK